MKDNLLNKRIAMRLPNYGGLYGSFIEDRSEPTPDGLATPKQSVGNSPPVFMKPNNIQALLNTFSPYDLYNKPNETPTLGYDYPTSAYNLNNDFGKMGFGPDHAILMSTEDSGTLPINSVKDSHFGDNRDKYVAGGVYSHEVAHENDTRLNWTRLGSYPNLGYMKRFGLEQPLMMREMPAMRAEDEYWKSLRGRMAKRAK